MNKTSIEWTDYTWNPVTGCHKVSRGCKHCYAETLTTRFAKKWGVKDFREIKLHHDRLSEPEKNKKKWRGKKVFVCSMSDLFQEGVPFEFINQVFASMADCPETIFQIPTKRPELAIEYLKWAAPVLFDEQAQAIAKQKELATYMPLKNVWIGTSCEDQATANERIPYLLQIPAAVRFLSCEPLVGPINICDSIRATQHPNAIHTTYFGDKLHWVIAGGESGHGAQPMHPDWVRSLRDQCKAANVPFFFKQWGEYLPLEFDAQPPFRRFANDGILIDGHHIDVLDPEDSFKPGRYNGHKFIDMMEAMSICENPSSDAINPSFNDIIDFWHCGKSKAGNLLDGVQHLNFPTCL